jgi:hypothetical protein
MYASACNVHALTITSAKRWMSKCRLSITQVEQLRAELSSRSGSGALVHTPIAPAAVGAEAGSPLAAGQNGSVEVLHPRTRTRMQLSWGSNHVPARSEVQFSILGVKEC